MQTKISCHLRPGDKPRGSFLISGRAYLDIGHDVTLYGSGQVSVADQVTYFEDLAAEALRLAQLLQGKPIDHVPTPQTAGS